MAFSGWAQPQCILLDQWDTGADARTHPWCQFLASRGDNCQSYVPGTRQNADQDLRDYLLWGYGSQLREWARGQGLGGRWEFKYFIWPDFQRGRSRVKCGTIAAQSTGLPNPAPPKDEMLWHMGGQRKYRKQTKRNKCHARKTRRGRKN